MESFIPLLEGYYTENDDDKRSKIVDKIDEAGSYYNHLLAKEPDKFLPILFQILESPLTSDPFSIIEII